MIKAVLFDLDGTLLPMNEDEFKKVYFGAVYQKVKHFGYKPEDLVNAIWFGTKAMVKNDGTMPNEERFWQAFSTIYPDSRQRDEKEFNDFYHNDFPKLAFACAMPIQPLAAPFIKELKNRGYEVIMIGNDVREDMIVNKLGIDSYLITDCLLNLDNEDINKYKHGTFKEIMDLVLARL